MDKCPVNKKINPFWIVCFVVLALYSVCFVGLFVYGIINSFKDFTDFIYNPAGLPSVWHFENYRTVFQFFSLQPQGVTGPTYNILHMFLFSILYSFGCSAANLLITSQVAYACARFNFKFSKVVYATVLFTMVMPIVGSLPSEMQVVTVLGLKNSFLGNYFLKASFINIYFMVLYAAFRRVSKEYKEAAEIDGASQFTVMIKIIYPMQTKTLLTIFLIYFIQYWNDYQTPLLYLPHYPTVALGLQRFQFSTRFEIAGEPIKMAAAIVVFIPIFTLFILMRNRIMGHVEMGGVKE